MRELPPLPPAFTRMRTVIGVGTLLWLAAVIVVAVTGPPELLTTCLVGTGLGPVAMGAAYTRLHSYDAGFVAFAVMLGIAFVLMFFLGAYNYPVHDDETLVGQSDARVPSDA